MWPALSLRRESVFQRDGVCYFITLLSQGKPDHSHYYYYAICFSLGRQLIPNWEEPLSFILSSLGSQVISLSSHDVSPHLTHGHNDTCHPQAWNSNFRTGKGTHAAGQTSTYLVFMEKLVSHTPTEATPLLYSRSSGQCWLLLESLVPVYYSESRQ